MTLGEAVTRQIADADGVGLAWALFLLLVIGPCALISVLGGVAIAVIRSFA